uniref:Cas scaffold protein family member 4 n=1 Tax=Gasterosteus aculeatus aculeatus TaxID=481459 RepID=A0AAQ4Q4T2_GASAC
MLKGKDGDHHNKLAKALYDNTAECADELAFRKGDIVTVMDQNVAGTSGWWMCSLYGRRGLAPANRLQLLPQTGTAEASLRHDVAQPNQSDAATNDKTPNIYQIPSVPRPCSSPAYERMDVIYKVPCTPSSTSEVYAVPPPLPQDSSYDIPVPSATEAQQKMTAGCSTIPGSCKPEWIYDVPVGPEKQSSPQGSYDPSKAKLVDTFPAHAWPNQRGSSTAPHYDIPKSNLPDIWSPPKVSIYDKPPTQKLTEVDGERGRTQLLSAAESQRISTASSSSTSSCDSLALSSSSPELLREVTLAQDEACCRLLELRESVCRAVPLLMEFVSSHWRSREHLEKHLTAIKQAAEGIVFSLTSFLTFALDVKGNARRLTDTNLQTRLIKQLSIVEDSGVILQQTVGALNTAGWPLDTLCQDPSQVQTPDQLERFVMVARTVPEDVKCLVSIVNANGKLLFRAPQKAPVPPNTKAGPETKEGPDGGHGGNSVEDDNDYVELQKVQKEPKENVPVSKAQVNERLSCESGGDTEEPRSASLTEHCRLYFGALHKAIGGFVGSLQDGHPPEKFISKSKLVIMVGQRLVDTLYKEAQRGGSSQSLLGKSNHLCALLKQLAVATKKAAVHFPDTQALREAQEFAKELAQRAQHFRTLLDV